jgi:hypothetical protein
MNFSGYVCALMLVIVGFVSCTPKLPEQQAPSPVEPGEAESGTPRHAIVSDREVELFGGLNNATAVRLGNLQAFVFRFAQCHGHLPDELEPVVQGSSTAQLFFQDMWHRTVRYSRAGKSYELRSAGEDGIFHTDDDVWVSSVIGRDRPCIMHTPERTTRLVPSCEEPEYRQ